MLWTYCEIRALAYTAYDIGYSWGVKNFWFWDDIVYGRPLRGLVLSYCQSSPRRLFSFSPKWGLTFDVITTSQKLTYLLGKDWQFCTANFRPVEHLNPWKVWYRNFSLRQSFYRSKVPSIRVDMVVTIHNNLLIQSPYVSVLDFLKSTISQNWFFNLIFCLFQTWYVLPV